MRVCATLDTISFLALRASRALTSHGIRQHIALPFTSPTLAKKMAGKQSIGSTIFVSTLLFIITLSLLQMYPFFIYCLTLQCRNQRTAIYLMIVDMPLYLVLPLS